MIRLPRVTSGDLRRLEVDASRPPNSAIVSVGAPSSALFKAVRIALQNGCVADKDQARLMASSRGLRAMVRLERTAISIRSGEVPTALLKYCNATTLVVTGPLTPDEWDHLAQYKSCFDLTIQDCPLSALPSVLPPRTRRLTFRDCPGAGRIGNWPSVCAIEALSFVNLRGLQSVKALPDGLKSLTLIHCAALKSVTGLEDRPALKLFVQGCPKLLQHEPENDAIGRPKCLGFMRRSSDGTYSLERASSVWDSSDDPDAD